MKQKYLVVFNNTRLQTFSFLEELAKTEHAADTIITMYDPIVVTEAKEGLEAVKFFHEHKDLPWTYTQEKGVFDQEQDYILFVGNFSSTDLTKIGSMMRDFTRDLQIYKDVKQICFLGNTRGLLQASIFYRKYPKLGPKIRCYSAEFCIGDKLGAIVYPKIDDTFLAFSGGVRNQEIEKKVEFFAQMFVSSHVTKMWIQFFTETMEGEDFRAKYYGRVMNEGEKEFLKTGSRFVLFLPSDGVDDDNMLQEMKDAAHETYGKIKDLVKNA